MSGASGAALGIELLKTVKHIPGLESHLVISRGAEKTIEGETEVSLSVVKALADRIYDIEDLGAAIASGTYRTIGMIVAPCSMKTVAGINSGYSENLLLRAADVTLKERRKLVLVPREAPFSTIHLRNMLSLSEMGVTIVPPVVSCYNGSETIDDMIRHIAFKILDLFGYEPEGFRRWGEGE